VEVVLDELGMSEQAELRIGSTEEKVLSGGQRKRVNLAIELVTDPVLLFLDEPTSGLSSQDTVEVIEVLRRLADQGRTIILTIHQPSAEVFARMHHVILLAKGGKLAFFGPTKPDSYEYFGPCEAAPDKLMAQLAEKTPEEWRERFLSSPLYQTYVEQRQAEVPDNAALLAETRRRGASAPALAQWWTLLRRYATIKLRDRLNLVFMIAQAPLVGLLLAAAFHDCRQRYMGRATPIFLMVIATIFFGCMNACREIVGERAIFSRERMVVLRLGPYLLSKLVVLGVVGAAQAVVLYAIVRVLVGIEGFWLDYVGVLAVASVAATALGLLVSTLVRSVEAAMAVVPILLVFQIVLGGYLIPLRASDKEYLEVAALPMISRWTTEALFAAEEHGLRERTATQAPTPASATPATTPPEQPAPPTLGPDSRCELPDALEPQRPIVAAKCHETEPKTGAPANVTPAWCWRCTHLEDNDLTPQRLPTDLTIIAGFAIGMLVACCLVLRLRDQR
jgi:energy-coupling factor transporter ATP-binding protein EcfA2